MYKIGVDLGGTNIAAGIVDENNSIIAKDSVRTDKEFTLAMKEMGSLINRLLSNNNISIEQCAYVGIGSPGMPNNDTGYMSDNSNLHWINVPMREELQKYINLPVYMENDANVAAWAEYLMGSGKNTTNFVALTLGTGVGGGIVINKKLYSGSHKAGAEIGHILLEKNGYMCGCGKKGCAEQYCSATALINKTKELLAEGKYTDTVLSDKNTITAKTVIDAAKDNDSLGVAVFDWYTDNLALLISSIINFVDPDVIALGGGVANAENFLLKPLKEKVHGYIMIDGVPYADIRIAQMKNDAGIIGAALLGK